MRSPMANSEKVKDFYLWDYDNTLFPMETCRLLIERNHSELSKYIVNISDNSKKDYVFLPQETVYASKPRHHLRRTMKLDPISEYFLYDLTYKNRRIFRESTNKNRVNFGYRFSNGSPLPIHESYKAFNSSSDDLKNKFRYFIKFDISAYFNSIYHHDMINWFASQRTTQSDVKLFGQYMREINTGFSIDFLPHGLYPSKMLGSHFLSFVDHSELIMCDNLVRFMDDFILFSDDRDVLVRDFQTIQKILGQKALNINSDKTVLFSDKVSQVNNEIDAIKSRITDKAYFSSGSGMEYQEYEQVVRSLNKGEVDYLTSLLTGDNATDDDASLVIDCIHEHTKNFDEYVPDFIYRFPHLSKKIFYKCSDVSSFDRLADNILDLIKSAHSLTEYQLFWLAKITEKYLLNSDKSGQILAHLYEHKDATTISKSKILEIPENRFGMPEWREQHLKNGSSGWLAWSSAIGMRNEPKQNRNYLMGYFSKASSLNSLIGEFVKSI